jgi:hypothetical protein
MMRRFLIIGFLLTSTFAFCIDYSFGDSLETLKNKNPGVTFNDTGNYPGHQFKTIEGRYLTTTETTFTFDSKMRLFQIIMKRNGVALDVYEPLVEKCTETYGEPKELYPITTNLNRGFSSANGS